MHTPGCCSYDKLLFSLASSKKHVIPSERQRDEESTHFVDICSKIGAKILRLRFAPLRMTLYFSAPLIP